MYPDFEYEKEKIRKRIKKTETLDKHRASNIFFFFFAAFSYICRLLPPTSNSWNAILIAMHVWTNIETNHADACPALGNV